MAKIKVEGTVVELDGDEMTRVIWKDIKDRLIPLSYTHLDVYKRQLPFIVGSCLAMRTCVQLLPRFHELRSGPTQAVASMTRICCVPVDNIGWLWTPATASVAGWHTSFENNTEPVLKKTGSPL